jgi:DNA-binding transcriptional ArsR family regulator
MSSGEERLTQDLVFDILSSARRRYVLYLLKTEGPMELTELSEHVAARENDTSVEELSRQQRKRVYVSLYQTHIPKLEDAGFVEYDQDSGQVTLRGRADEVDQYLGSEEPPFPWHYAYLAVAVVGLVLGALVATDTLGFAAVGWAGAAVVMVAGVLLVASAHAVSWMRSRQGALSELDKGPGEE